MVVRSHACGLALAAPAQAKRVALVVDNGSYQVGPLANPVRDAEAVADAFKRLGFDEVELKTDGMRAALSAFGAEAAGADIAVVYSPVTDSRRAEPTTSSPSMPSWRGPPISTWRPFSCALFSIKSRAPASSSSSSSMPAAIRSFHGGLQARPGANLARIDLGLFRGARHSERLEEKVKGWFESCLPALDCIEHRSPDPAHQRLADRKPGGTASEKTMLNVHRGLRADLVEMVAKKCFAAPTAEVE